MRRLGRTLRYEIIRTMGDDRIALATSVVVMLGLLASLAWGGTAEERAFLVYGPEKAPDSPWGAVDLLLLANSGMEPFDPMTKRFFILDMMWATPYVLLGYLTCSAFSGNARGLLAQIAVRSQSRYALMGSKFARAVIVALGFFALEVASSMLTALATNAPLGSVCENAGVYQLQRGAAEIAFTVTLVAVSLVAYAVFTTAASAIAGSVPAFLASIALIVASGYFDTPCLFIGGSMTARSGLATGDWNYASGCFAASLSIAAISLICGFIKARRKEFL